MASSSVLALVRSLRSEAGDDFATALDTTSTLLQNILEQPEEPKFRTVRLGNAAFHRRLGRFNSGLGLLRALGFEDACQDGTVGTPSHLALAEADPSTLAHGLVLVKAAREAHGQVLQEQQSASLAAPAAPAAPPSAAAPAASSSRSNGKRPAREAVTTDDGAAAKRAATDASADDATGATAATGAAVELSSYAANDIDQHFLALCGGAFLEGLSAVDAPTFARLCATARDAKRVSAATGDKEAEARASHWCSALEEHGQLLGWAVEDHGDDDDHDDDDDVGGSGGSDVTGAASASAAGPSCAGASGSATVMETAFDEPVVIAQDGNFDVCAVCEVGGLLLCCEACPQAYHRECLGAQAPPDDDDDDAVWFCPPCATAFAT